MLEVRVLLSIFFHKKNDDPRALNGRAWLGRWLLLVCLSCVLGWMPRAGAEDLAVPELSGWVVDEAQVLTGEQRQALDQMLQQFEQQKGAQIFMLTLPSLAGEDIDSYAVRVFEEWGVGRQAADDGCCWWRPLRIANCVSRWGMAWRVRFQTSWPGGSFVSRLRRLFNKRPMPRG